MRAFAGGTSLSTGVWLLLHSVPYFSYPKLSQICLATLGTIFGYKFTNQFLEPNSDSICFKCDLCHTNFTRKGSVTLHYKRVHEGKKPRPFNWLFLNFLRKTYYFLSFNPSIVKPNKKKLIKKLLIIKFVIQKWIFGLKFHSIYLSRKEMLCVMQKTWSSVYKMQQICGVSQVC